MCKVVIASAGITLRRAGISRRVFRVLELRQYRRLLLLVPLAPSSKAAAVMCGYVAFKVLYRNILIGYNQINKGACQSSVWTIDGDQISDWDRSTPII